MDRSSIPPWTRILRCVQDKNTGNVASYTIPTHQSVGEETLVFDSTTSGIESMRVDTENAYI